MTGPGAAWVLGRAHREAKIFKAQNPTLIADWCYGWKQTQLVFGHTADRKPAIRLRSFNGSLSQMDDRAVCVDGFYSHNQPAPFTSCMCGYYSHRLTPNSDNGYGSTLIRVANAGQILGYTEGYRSERQVVTDIYCAPSCSTSGCEADAKLLVVMANSTIYYDKHGNSFNELEGYCQAHVPGHHRTLTLDEVARLTGVATSWLSIHSYYSAQAS